MGTRQALIESGSLTPGIDPACFGLPSFCAVRYEQPHADFAGLVADYHVLDSEGPLARGASEAMLPNAFTIRLILTRDPMRLEIGNAVFDPLPPASLYGTTTRLGRLTVSNGGVTVGIRLHAAGFARLFRTDAYRLRDTVVPLHSLLDPAWVDAVMTDLQKSDQGRDVAPLLDRHLAPLLARPHPHENDIERISRLLVTPGVVNLREAAEEIGIAAHRLTRLTRRHFGYPPKVLLMRARFLRSILAMKLAGRMDIDLLDPLYFDQSHFIRDSHRFLGMAPAEFLRQPTPFMDAVLRARSMILGSPLAALEMGG